MEGDFTKSINQAQDEIIAEFKIFDSWVARHSYLAEISKKMPPLGLEYINDEHIIRGCQVKTWYRCECRDGRVFYEMDSGSAVIKGILFLLQKILSGREPQEIAAADLYFIDKTGLREDFSPLRANSLLKIVSRMRSDADGYATFQKK